MKIVIIRHSIRNRGGDRLVLDYCSYFLDRGHEIIYWTNELNTQFPVDPRIQIKKIPVATAMGTIIFSLFTKFEGDIVIVDLVVMSVFAWFLNGKKVLYLAQDDDRSYYSSPLLRGIIDSFYRLSLTIMKIRVISVSEDLARQLDFFAPGRIKVVSNGVNLKKFYHEQSSRFLSERQSPGVIILYVRQDYRKGLDIGIKALEELNRIRNKRDWELWTIGDNTVDIKLDGIRVSKKGFLKDDDLRSVFSAADIYLSPSRHEGLSLILLEAMACGCVMVSTKANFWLQHEVHGLVSEIEDWQSLAQNLNRVLSDSPLLEKLKKNGYELVKDYNFEKSCVQFESALL